MIACLVHDAGQVEKGLAVLGGIVLAASLTKSHLDARAKARRARGRALARRWGAER